MNRSIALIGCGKAGLSVSLALKSAGWTVTSCSSLSDESTRRGVEWLACNPMVLWNSIPQKTAILLGVPEGALKEVDERLAREDAHLKGRVVIHLSGGLPARVLERCRLGGASVGSLHPIMALPDPLTGAKRLKAATFAIEGRAKAVGVMQAIAHSISDRFFLLSPRGKVLYHAAAVVASNHLLALLSDSQAILERAGADMATALPAFQSLVEGTVANFFAGGGAVAALTGPVERGDSDMVKNHLQSLKRWPAQQERYRVMALATLRIAMQRHPGREKSLLGLAKMLEEWQSSGGKG